MISPLPLVCLITLAARFPGGAAVDQDPLPALELERPAPNLGLEDWVGDREKPSSVIHRVIGESVGGDIEIGDLGKIEGLDDLDPKSSKDLPDYHGDVVIVHVLTTSHDPADRRERIALIRAAMEANEDRSLQPIGIATAANDEQTAERVSQAGITWPVVTAGEEAPDTPYLDAKWPHEHTIFLIGRSGELIWQGDPLVAEKDFFKALEDALQRLELPRLERELAGDLGSALDHYYVGRLSKAVSAASKVLKRTDDPTVEQDAQHLLDKIREGELEWVRTMRKASGRRADFDDFVRYVDALVAAFPRASGKEAQGVEKELGRDGRDSWRLRAERRWAKLNRDRPPLFPALRTKASDRFARNVQKFVDDANHSPESKRTGQDLLDRYRGASRGR